MFNHEPDYPIAVTSKDDAGLSAGLRWCADRRGAGERLTVWTHLKSNLGNNRLLSQFVVSRRDVDHVTSRGGAFVRHSGPVLMAWPDPGDIAEFTGRNGRRLLGGALPYAVWGRTKLYCRSHGSSESRRSVSLA